MSLYYRPQFTVRGDCTVRKHGGRKLIHVRHALNISDVPLVIGGRALTGFFHGIRQRDFFCPNGIPCGHGVLRTNGVPDQRFVLWTKGKRNDAVADPLFFQGFLHFRRRPTVDCAIQHHGYCRHRPPYRGHGNGGALGQVRVNVTPDPQFVLCRNDFAPIRIDPLVLRDTVLQYDKSIGHRIIWATGDAVWLAYRVYARNGCLVYHGIRKNGERRAQTVFDHLNWFNSKRNCPAGWRRIAIRLRLWESIFCKQLGNFRFRATAKKKQASDTQNIDKVLSVHSIIQLTSVAHYRIPAPPSSSIAATPPTLPSTAAPCRPSSFVAC